MKKQFKDPVQAFFLTSVIFLGILIIDNIKSIQDVNPIVLFVACFLGLLGTIKLMKFVFKWQ